MVFFKNSNCEGTPATQANTVPFYQPGCVVAAELDNGSIFYKYATLQKYAVGNPFDTYAVKVVDFMQTDTCDSAGIKRNDYFKSGDCMNYSSTEHASNKFVVNDGTVILEIYPCANCACAVMSTGTLPQNECEVDREGDDYNSYHYSPHRLHIRSVMEKKLMSPYIGKNHRHIPHKHN